MSFIVSRLGCEDATSALRSLSVLGLQIPSADRFASFLALDSIIFLAASTDNVCIGFCYAYELQRPDGDNMLFLYSIDVAPKHRKRGVATALIRSLLQIAKDRGSKKVFVLTTLSNEAAIALYQLTGGRQSSDQAILFEYPITNPTAD